MTITLKDLKHLEVMSTLENATPRKAPEINIKELLAEKTDREPTLNEKIVSLCTKLRTEGFEKQAESLETKFLAYKAAGATHLYRTHDEDGEDLIDFAHPDGEVKVEDASKDLGHVETIVTEHKKLVDIVNKQPTGKLASKYNDALKYITAQDVNELGTVNLQEISKKFQYMADYLNKHFTGNPPEGVTLPEHARNFYGTLGVWEDTARAIATELNHNQALPITQAMQLVKNRLQNSQSRNVQQYVTKVNHVSDIDKLVSWILSWAEDNNPMKKSASLDLTAYIKKCKSVLERSAGLADLPALTFYDFYKSHFGDIIDNVEILYRRLGALTHKSEIDQLPALQSEIKNIAPDLSHIMDAEDNIRQILSAPEAHLKTIEKYKNMFNIVQNKLPNLILRIKQGKNAMESGAMSKLYNLVLFTSDFDYAIEAARNLKSSIFKFTSLLENSKTTDFKPTTQEGIDLSIEKETNNVDAAIAQLKEWSVKLPAKANIPADKKQEGLVWINQQIKELQDNKSNPEKVNALIKENKAFENEWMI